MEVLKERFKDENTIIEKLNDEILNYKPANDPATIKSEHESNIQTIKRNERKNRCYNIYFSNER